MHLIHAQKLWKRYGRQTVLEQEELIMPRGLHLLIGPNGSGKSTFLKIIGGLIPTKGKLRLWEEIDLKKDRIPHRKAVSWAQAEPAFPPFISGQYLLDMYAELRQAPAEQIQDLQERLSAQGFLQQQIETYSSGMKKKLSLLLALMGDPRLILLDEPFNTLDPVSQQALGRIIKERVAAGKDMILASHQPPPAVDLQFQGYWVIQDHQLIAIPAADLQAWMQGQPSPAL
ncbi:MAG: ATP-binding cassette domain-containing protein [Bacteroidota bacterium]